MEFVLPVIETIEVEAPQSNTMEREEKAEDGDQDDPVESQVKAVYERRRLAQLVAAKKKVGSQFDRAVAKAAIDSVKYANCTDILAFE
jgi:phosphoribosylformylglycinamidine (FGAM) synthase-like enzyme